MTGKGCKLRSFEGMGVRVVIPVFVWYTLKRVLRMSMVKIVFWAAPILCALMVILFPLSGSIRVVSEVLSCVGILASFVIVQVLAFCDRSSGFGEVLRSYDLSEQRRFWAYALASLILSLLWIVVGLVAITL